MPVSALSHLTNSMLVVYALEWLKGTATYRRFAQALPLEMASVHVLMSAIGALATSLGMHGAVQGTTAAGWSLTLTIPPLWILLHAAWEWAQQLALNQIVYALAVQQKQAAPVVTARVSPSLSVTASMPDVVAAPPSKG
jgi:hypothetical protein